MEAKEFDKLTHNQRMSFICKKCEPAAKNKASINRGKELLFKL